MKSYTKGLITGIVAGIIVATSTTGFAEDGLQAISAYLRTDLPIILDGEKLELQNKPITYNGLTYLPLKELGNIAGKKVLWNPELRQVEISSIIDVPTQSAQTQTDPISEPQKTPSEPLKISFGETYDTGKIKITPVDFVSDEYGKRFFLNVETSNTTSITGILYETKLITNDESKNSQTGFQTTTGTISAGEKKSININFDKNNKYEVTGLIIRNLDYGINVMLSL